MVYIVFLFMRWSLAWCEAFAKSQLIGLWQLVLCGFEFWSGFLVGKDIRS